MINALNIRAFKCFRNARISTLPLTILAGVNGAGKSTTIQGMLLARAAQQATSKFVALNGPFGLTLGETVDVLNRDSDLSEGIQIGIEYDDTVASWLFRSRQTDDERRVTLEIEHRPEDDRHPLALPGRGFCYLSAERLGPRDSLPPSSLGESDVTLGVQGENIAQVLATLDRSPVHYGRRHPNAPAGSFSLPHHVELWASSIIRPMQIKANWVPGVAVTTLRFREPDSPDWNRPFNTGFGISYALPVIVAAMTTSSGGTLLVENPEAHLHPAGQSAIGHLLARVAADGVQVFVETHSDHVLNGIRRAIGVDGAIKSSDAVVIFFSGESGSEGAKFETLQFTPAGGLDRWPERFFDQYRLDVESLATVRRGPKPIA